jgi:hypothetical protein
MGGCRERAFFPVISRQFPGGVPLAAGTFRACREKNKFIYQHIDIVIVHIVMLFFALISRFFRAKIAKISR